MRLLAALVLCAIVPAAALAAAKSFVPYPHSKPDVASAKQAEKLAPGTHVGVWTSTDSFEQVVAFYKARYSAYKMPGTGAVGAQRVKMAFFMLDGAADISKSRSWMKVQRPFVGNFSFHNGAPQPQDVRDLTAIETVTK